MLGGDVLVPELAGDVARGGHRGVGAAARGSGELTLEPDAAGRAASARSAVRRRAAKSTPDGAEQRGRDAVRLREQRVEQVRGLDLGVPVGRGPADRGREGFLAAGGELEIHVLVPSGTARECRSVQREQT